MKALIYMKFLICRIDVWFAGQAKVTTGAPEPEVRMCGFVLKNWGPDGM
jgi:hypothetical protein